MSLTLLVNLIIGFLLLNVGTILLLFIPLAILWFLIRVLTKPRNQARDDDGNTSVS